MLNVMKRGKSWQYRFDAASVNGKRKQISKSGFATKKEAVEAGTKAMAEYNSSGQCFEPSSISVADYLDFWFDNYVKMNLKYNTQVAYLSIIEKHLKPRFGIYKLSALQASSIQEMVNQLKINGLSKSQVTNILCTLSGALNYAVEPLHYLQFNPCKNVKIPKYREKETSCRYIITNDSMKKILERFPEGSNFYIAIMIGYYTGLRISECFALTWDDIDFDNKTLSVNKITVKRNHGVDARKMQGKKERQEKSTWYFGEPKTFGSKRTIMIGDTLYKVLKKEKSRQLKNEMQYGEYYTKIYKKPEKDEKGEIIYRLLEMEKSVPVVLSEANLICRKENGQLLSTDSFKYASRVIAHELCIPFNFHSLRHTHATLLIENGADIKDVQKRLGHERIETTLNTYTHDTKEMQKKSVDIFEAIAK